MASPFNPLNWVKSAQDWFSKTERSSGFRPYLIFFILNGGLNVSLLAAFPANATVHLFAMASLGVAGLGFIIFYGVKAFQDPNFCRSEKHIENVRKYEMMQSKGDPYPQVIDSGSLRVISKSELPQLPPGEPPGTP